MRAGLLWCNARVMPNNALRWPAPASDAADPGALTAQLRQIARQSPWFMAALQAARGLDLRSWCIGAGAVRNLVWDHLHGHAQPSALADIDLAHWDPTRPLADDAELQIRLADVAPQLPWEVTNQAHVHTWFESVFGHAVAPLGSLHEAVASWPETATAVGLALDGDDRLHVIAPLGLDDLFAMRVQRNPQRVSLATYRARVAQKRYSERWPLVQVVPA